jgi:hypothetical protein
MVKLLAVDKLKHQAAQTKTAVLAARATQMKFVIFSTVLRTVEKITKYQNSNLEIDLRSIGRKVR